MPKRHIRDRKKKPLEEGIKVGSAKAAQLEKTLKERSKEVDASTKAALNTFGLPKSLPELADISPEKLNETIGVITRSGGMLNMHNPVMQGIGAIGLAYAVKPELVRGFLGSPVGSAVAGGVGSYMLGDSVGRMLGGSATLSTGVTGALGYAFGTTLGVPALGMLFGGAGGFFGGRSKRKAKREMRSRLESAYFELEDARKDAIDAEEKLAGMRDVQIAAFENFLDHADLARQSLLLGKDAIEAQRTRLNEQRDINIGIIAQNTNEINRTSDIKNEAIRRETNKILARQKVQIGARGISDAGSSWYILGETESMGLKAEQEVYLSRKTALVAEEQKYRELMTEYGDMSKALTDYASGVDTEIKGWESDVRRTKTEFETNLTALDIESKRLHRRIDNITSRMYGIASQHNKAGGAMLGRMSARDKVTFMNSMQPSVFGKEQKLLEKAERKAGALAAISLGDAIRTTQAGINPFDALSIFGRG